MSERNSQSSSRRKKVPRKVDENGNYLPHRHEHKSRLLRHKNGQIAPTSEVASSVDAFTVCPVSTYDVCTNEMTTYGEFIKKQGNSQLPVKPVYDKYSIGPNLKPLHIMQNLEDFRTDTIDTFDQLDINIPKRNQSKFTEKCVNDTITMTDFALESEGPPPPILVNRETIDEDKTPRTTQSFTSFYGDNEKSEVKQIFQTEDEPSVIPIEVDIERNETQRSEIKSFIDKPIIDTSSLYPSSLNTPIFHEFISRKLITRIDDVMEQEFIPLNDQEDLNVYPDFQSDVEEMVTATIGSAEFVEVSDDDPNAQLYLELSDSQTEPNVNDIQSVKSAFIPQASLMNDISPLNQNGNVFTDNPQFNYYPINSNIQPAPFLDIDDMVDYDIEEEFEEDIEEEL